jgi:hypothetical protein
LAKNKKKAKLTSFLKVKLLLPLAKNKIKRQASPDLLTFEGISKKKKEDKKKKDGRMFHFFFIF